ncbi:MAG: glutamate 5-kinase [Pirellulales bacterium]|jgi:glutamate 5-kinase|nr:glutamate 5-kinase [Pirellulales bacterium]
MVDLLRQEIAAEADLLVVKVGTRVLTGEDGLLNYDRIAGLSEQIHWAMQHGRKLVLVSSGAVGAGMGQLGLTQRPTDLSQLQAVAAVGQSRLVEAYDKALGHHGRCAAQVLLTAEDMDDRVRYLNVRNTLLALMEYGAVPIVNENDTVAVDELLGTFGDNDRLAALLTQLLRAPLLVLLSDVEGLYDGAPDDPKSKVISNVTAIDDSVRRLVQPSTFGGGRGGMASKLEAARIATAAGESVILASGFIAGNLEAILSGEPVGTLFVPQGQSVSLRKRWIGYTVQPRGWLVIDPGAQRALVQQGRSLLPIGVVAMRGNYQKGDVVVIEDKAGLEIARGLTNYSAEDLGKIKGLKSDAIAAVLSHCPYAEVVHRDNLVVTTQEL